MNARSLIAFASALAISLSTGCSTINQTMVKWGLKKTDFEDMGAHSAPQMAQNIGAPGTLKNVPPSVTNPSLLADHLRRAQTAESQRKNAEAKMHYDRVLQLQANNPVAHHRLAVLADQEQNYIAAERHYLAALNSDSRNPDLLSDVGYSYFLQGRYRDGELYMKQALQIQPNHQTVMNNLGLLYAKQGMYDEAQNLYAQHLNSSQANRRMAELFPKGKPTLPGGDMTQLANQPSETTLLLKRQMDQEKEKARLARQRQLTMERMQVERRGLENLPGHRGPYQPGQIGAPDPRIHSTAYNNPHLSDGQRLKQQLSYIDQSYQQQELLRRQEAQRQRNAQAQQSPIAQHQVPGSGMRDASYYPNQHAPNQTMPASHQAYPTHRQPPQHQVPVQPTGNEQQRPMVDPRQNMSVWPEGNTHSYVPPTQHQHKVGTGVVHHGQQQHMPSVSYPQHQNQSAIENQGQHPHQQQPAQSSATMVGMNAGSGMPIPMVNPQPNLGGSDLRMQRRDHLYSHRPTQSQNGDPNNQQVQPADAQLQPQNLQQFDRLQSPHQHRQSQFRQRFQQPVQNQGQGSGVIHPTSYQQSPGQTQHFGQPQNSQYEAGPVITPAAGQQQFRQHYP